MRRSAVFDSVSTDRNAKYSIVTQSRKCFATSKKTEPILSPAAMTRRFRVSNKCVSRRAPFSPTCLLRFVSRDPLCSRAWHKWHCSLRMLRYRANKIIDEIGDTKVTLPRSERNHPTRSTKLSVLSKEKSKAKPRARADWKTEIFFH